MNFNNQLNIHVYICSVNIGLPKNKNRIDKTESLINSDNSFTIQYIYFIIYHIYFLKSKKKNWVKQKYSKDLNYPSGGGKEFHLSRVRMHCVRQIGGADPAGAGTREWGPFLPLTLTPKSMQVAPTGELATMSFNISYSLDYLTTCSLT